jgi:hypothetical protein
VYASPLAASNRFLSSLASKALDLGVLVFDLGVLVFGAIVFLIYIEVFVCIFSFQVWELRVK